MERRRICKKRYLLWPLRDVLDMLNGSAIDDGESFQSTFDKALSFTLFYKFIKVRKQYIFNNKIPHNTCLCEVCENTTLLGKGLNQACNVKKIPSDLHAIVEEYSCCSDSKDCMMSSCNDCKSHGLTAEYFEEEQQQKQSAEESDSASDSTNETFDSVKFLQWKRGADGYLTKVRTEVDIAEALGLWQSMVEVLKAHIYQTSSIF